MRLGQATKLKPAGIYRKLTVMASSLLGIVFAVMCGQAWSGPVLPASAIEAIVARAVNDDAAGLASARGLRPGRPFTVRVLDRAHMAAEREAAERGARTPAVIAAEARMLAFMGLERPASPGPDEAVPTAAVVDLTGFYDPTSKRIYVGNWVAFTSDRAARLKDAAEAVLDRRFGLAERQTNRHGPEQDVSQGGGDALWARIALFEGDATVQALERLSPDGAMPPTRALAGELYEVRKTFEGEGEGDDQGGASLDVARRVFVVLDGASFVARVRARAPWSAVNQLWERPPVSTEQLLHPDKYERREVPDDVGARWPARSGSGTPRGEVVYSDTLGELGARAFLERAVGPYRAERAATGWGGDRVRLIRGQEGEDGVAPEFAAWLTTWDGASDAQDFAEQAGLALASLAGAPLAEVGDARRRHPRGGAREPKRWRCISAAGRAFDVEWREAAVVILVGAPPDAERALPALVAAATARRRGRSRSR
jgi:hypothetical protein